MSFLDALKAYPALLFATAGFVGLCVGSFLNVVIHRLPRMMEAQWRAECAALAASDQGGAEQPAEPVEPYNLLQPPSRCPACAAPIRPWQNIPVASWLWLRGRCAACSAPISFRYPAVETAAGALAVLAAWRFGATGPAMAAMLFLWALLALTFIDLDTQLLPDDITFPLLWAGLLVNAFGAFTDLRSAVFGAAGGYLILWTVYWGFRLLAKKEGMGYGDFKLLAALGAWTGWQVLPFIVLVSAGTGAIIGGLLLWRSKSGADTRIPFGPYLALGGVAGMLWGRQAVILWIGHFPGVKLLVGLTGGIGSGKTTVATHLAALGASVVDTDEISRHLTGPAGAAMAALREAFGARFVSADGSLDRAAMRALAFEDPAARGRLESILHPAIRSAADAELAGAPGPYAVIVVPLLFETRGYLQRVARTLVVDCPESLQASRTARRSGLAAEEVRAIMAAQWPRWRRLQLADDVIWNGGDEAALAPQCERMHRFYLGNAGAIAPQSGPSQRGVR